MIAMPLNDALEIQIFQEKYGQQVLELILGIQQNEFGLPITAGDQPDLADIPEFYQRDGSNFWVAVQNQRVVGTIALLDIGNHQGALRKMFVGKGFRGSKTGTASSLLTALLVWAKTEGIKNIFLGTTSRFLAAHRFYEKNGFMEIEKDRLPPTFPVMGVDTKFYRHDG